MSTQNIERIACEAIESKNYKEARRLLIPLSEQGSAYALNALAWMHEIGVLGEVDKNVARSYYEKAATGGSREAYYGLGLLLLGESKEAEARQAFEKGAEMGSLSCMYKLGVLLTGEQAKRIEKDAGIGWLQKAADQGHILSQRRILSMQFGASKSFVGKARISFKVLRLAKHAFFSYLKDKNSEKLI